MGLAVKMIKENFIDFLKTGQLSHFPFGMEMNIIVDMLGEYDELIENEESSMIKYDRIEFYFYKGEKESNRLDGILIQPIPIAANRGKLDMDYGWLDKKMDFKKSSIF